MSEMTPEEIGKEIARQAIQHVMKSLKERVMTVQLPIPAVSCVTKYSLSENNPVTFAATHSLLDRDLSRFCDDDYAECPLCHGDWHGLTGDGVNGAVGCPGECGTNEEKQRRLESPPADADSHDAIVAQCTGFLSMVANLLFGDDEPPYDAMVGDASNT